MFIKQRGSHSEAPVSTIKHITYLVLLVFIQSNKMNTANTSRDKNVGMLQPDCYCTLTYHCR